jgi:hypothetical protein
MYGALPAEKKQQAARSSRKEQRAGGAWAWHASHCGDVTLGYKKPHIKMRQTRHHGRGLHTYSGMNEHGAWGRGTGGEQGMRSAAAAHRQKADRWEVTGGCGCRGEMTLRKNCKAWERAVRNLKKLKNGSAGCGSFIR